MSNQIKSKISLLQNSRDKWTNLENNTIQWTMQRGPEKQACRYQAHVLIFGKLLDPPLEKDKFSLEKLNYTPDCTVSSMHFQNFLGRGSPSPLPRSIPRSSSGFAFDSRFDLKSLALRALGLGFTLNSPPIHHHAIHHQYVSPNKRN